MAFNHMIEYLPIYKAALLDDWDSVSRIFEQDPELLTKPITYSYETPLHIAVGTNRSNSFVTKLVESIIAIGASDKLFVMSSGEQTPLHYAANVGNTIAARILVELNPGMTQILNVNNKTPLKLAAWHGHKDTLKYLLTVTHDLAFGEDGISSYRGVDGGDLITLTIMDGFYDLALEIIDAHPNIVLESDRDGKMALEVLAMKPNVFPSESKLSDRDGKMALEVLALEVWLWKYWKYWLWYKLQFIASDE